MDTPLTDPFKQFSNWFEQAKKTGIDKPNAMTLSTCNRSGQPSSRIVLLSSFSESGFVFHTNYLSDKGHEMGSNDQVSLLFWWDELGYQVRIQGKVEKTSSDDSDEYFANRPRGSQIGAWASEQSRSIQDRAVLDQRMVDFTEQFHDKPVPRPPHWGGYVVRPDYFEFWLNRDDRLHDRFRYELSDGSWAWSRLAP